MLRAIGVRLGAVRGLCRRYPRTNLQGDRRDFGVVVGPRKPYAHTNLQGDRACTEAARNLTNGCTALL
jgi:hypothetical protein